jgi:hypothetical protein
MANLSAWTSQQFDPRLNWGDVEWIKKRWGGKLILKGIQDVEDAKLAADSGADALIVSNHGGRQLDGAQSSIEALPAIVADVVGSRSRCTWTAASAAGQDVLKAWALGARGTYIGRAFLYGLGAMGEAGVTKALQIIHKELDLTMAFCGHTHRGLGGHLVGPARAADGAARPLRGAAFAAAADRALELRPGHRQRGGTVRGPAAEGHRSGLAVRAVGAGPGRGDAGHRRGRTLAGRSGRTGSGHAASRSAAAAAGVLGRLQPRAGPGGLVCTAGRAVASDVRRRDRGDERQRRGLVRAPLPRLLAAQCLAGAGWALLLCAAFSGALALGHTGREGLMNGSLQATLAAAALARIAIVTTTAPAPAQAVDMAWWPAAGFLVCAGLLVRNALRR